MRSPMRSPMRSLASTLLFQVSAILMATVGIALCVSCLVYMEGAEAERRAITTEQALTRTAAVARVVAAVPPRLQADAVEAASGANARGVGHMEQFEYAKATE